MRIFTTLPQENLAKVGPAAQAIEAAGYTGVSTQENKHEPFLSLAVAGAASKTRMSNHEPICLRIIRLSFTTKALPGPGWCASAGSPEKPLRRAGALVRDSNHGKGGGL